MPHMVFAFVLGYICMSHIYRTYVDYMGWSLDFTGPQVTRRLLTKPVVVITVLI